MSLDTRVAIVDDHEMVRAGLRAVIEATGRMKVVAEASSGEEALRVARTLRPDVTLMDISMPVMDGIEATREIAALELDLRILVLTRHDHEEYLEPVMAAGAMGFIRKSRPAEQLIQAIDLVASGRTTMPAKAALLYSRRKERAESEGDWLARLSEHERKILELTARGYTASEIAPKLVLAPRTVENYRGRMRTKLGLSHRHELVALALKAGLLEDDEA